MVIFLFPAVREYPYQQRFGTQDKNSTVRSMSPFGNDLPLGKRRRATKYGPYHVIFPRPVTTGLMDDE